MLEEKLTEALQLIDEFRRDVVFHFNGFPVDYAEIRRLVAEALEMVKED